MDLHADQIQGFFDCPVDHLYASSVLMPYIANEVGLDNLVMASPDAGGSKRAYTYSKYFNVPMVMCDKHRDKPNSIGEMFLIGDVTDKDVVLVDDMVDTAGTITKVEKKCFIVYKNRDGEKQNEIKSGTDWRWAHCS